MGKMKLEALQVKSFTTNLNDEKGNLIGGGTDGMICQGSAMLECPTEAAHCSAACTAAPDCNLGGGGSGQFCTIDAACDTDPLRCGATFQN